MNKLLSFLLTASLVFLSTGCIVDDNGTEGPPGPRGPEGPPGNANVFSLNFLFSMDAAVINGNVASVQFEVPDITPSVVDDGAVLLFFREQGTWTAMPYTFAVESPDLPAVDYTISLGFGYDDAFLEVFYEASTDEVALEDQPDRDIKAVVIDGFPLGKQDVDWTDYEAVKTFFGLKD